MSSPIHDIVIIGAGPAGLSAARHLSTAQPGLRLALYDCREPWSAPIPCAEGVGKLGFHEAVDVLPGWIRHEVDKAAFHAPDTTTITYTDKNKGYIIDRAAMQRDLAHQCARQGVVCRFDRRVCSLSAPDAQGVRTIVFSDSSSVRSRVVIDCAGPLSRLGNQEGLDWKPADLEPACFAHIRLDTVATDTAHIYMGSVNAPGGYGWSFPRDEHSANVGILVGNAFRKGAQIRTLLHRFIQENFPGATIERTFAGSIPCYRQRRKMAFNGLLKAGDAASTVNPISRAGIVEALLCGRLAAQSAHVMLGACSTRDLNRMARAYEKAWYALRGRTHLKLARVKHELARIPDQEFNNAAAILQTIPRDTLTMSTIFRICLGRTPRLMWAMRHLM